MLVLFVASVLFLPTGMVLPIAPAHKRAPLNAADSDVAQRRELLPAARRLAAEARQNKAGLPRWAVKKPQVMPGRRRSSFVGHPRARRATSR